MHYQERITSIGNFQSRGASCMQAESRTDVPDRRPRWLAPVGLFALILILGLVVGCDAFVGPQGPKGQTGSQGQIGPRGETGAQGETGVQGERGQQGISGPRGEIGPRGETGLRGDRGPSGLNGDWTMFSIVIEFDKKDLIMGFQTAQISFEIAEIGPEVVEVGTVDVFIETGTGWTALPSTFIFDRSTSANVNLTYSYSLGELSLHYSTNFSDQVPERGILDGRLKIVLLIPA